MNFKKVGALLMLITLVSLAFTTVVMAAEYRPGGNSGKDGISEAYAASIYYDRFSRIPLTGDGRLDTVSIALSQIGYSEGDDEAGFSGTTNGTGNFTEFNYNFGKYSTTYGGDYAWCASFVSFSLYQAKTHDYNKLSDWCRDHTNDSNYIWREISCQNWLKQLDKFGYFKKSKSAGGNYTPTTGDLIFFKKSTGTTSSHIGLVVYCDGSTVYTVEGNTSQAAGLDTNGGGVYFKSYDLSYSNIMGYGVLPYATNANAITPDYTGNTVTKGIFINTNYNNSGVSISAYNQESCTTKSATIAINDMFEVVDIVSEGVAKVKFYRTNNSGTFQYFDGYVKIDDVKAAHVVQAVAYGDEYVDSGCPHNWKDATFTAPKTCSLCDETEGKALGHTETTLEAVAPTCTAAGKTEGKYCSVCDTVTVAQKTVAAKGHTEEIVPGKAPTCTEIGWDLYVTCKNCDYSTYTEKAIVPHVEVVDAAVPATCTTAGKTAGKHCSVCNAVIEAQETVAAKGHTEEIVPGKAPTCTEAGLTDGKKCTACGETTVKQNEVPVLGHETVEYSAKAPTCTEIGWDLYVACKNCDYSTYAEKAIVPHVEVVDAAVPATCTTAGKTAGKHCSVCGKVLVAQETVSAKGHTEETLPAVAATCTTAGKTAGKKCTVCQTVTVAQTTVAATGHNEASTAAVAPTCTTAGKTVGKICSVCNAVLQAAQTIPALGHTEITHPAVAATCVTPGKTAGKECAECGEILVEQKLVAATGHTEVVDAAVAPTCTEAGKTEGKHCSVCNEVLAAQTTVAAKGHTEVTDAAVAPTCTEAGKTEGKHCSVCNTVTKAQETVAATGHTEVVDAAVAPTCTEAGKTEGKHCSVCNEITAEQEAVVATGHDYAVGGKCKNCDDVNEEMTTVSNDTVTEETPNTGANISGCGSSVAGFGALIVAIFSAIGIFFRKKEEN